MQILTLKLTKMGGEYDIRLIEEHEAVNFYSIMLEGEELTELENFSTNFLLGVSMMRRWM